MTRIRREEVERLVREASRRPPEELASFLQQAARDPELRAEVERALAAEALATGAGGEGDGVPERIGGYRVERTLGEGGMGVVYAARSDAGEEVALKVLKPTLLPGTARKRFDLEVRVMQRLEHPGVARLVDAGVDDFGIGPRPYFAMELVRGLPLLEYAEARDLDVAARLALVVAICGAVHHAHQKGVIHRDLKPGNVLVDESGRPKILDFGVARVTDPDLGLTAADTEAGALVGTFLYMSPEQVAGERGELDSRSDVYALGLLAFELLTGRLPYDLRGKPLPAVARLISAGPTARLGDVDPRLRGDLETIVGRALAKDRGERYDTASELAADLTRFLEGRPLRARPGDGRATSASPGWRVLVAFSPQDEQEKERLVGQLELARAHGVVRAVEACSLGSAEEWKEALAGPMARCHALVLLASDELVALDALRGAGGTPGIAELAGGGRPVVAVPLDGDGWRAEPWAARAAELSTPVSRRDGARSRGGAWAALAVELEELLRGLEPLPLEAGAAGPRPPTALDTLRGVLEGIPGACGFVGRERELAALDDAYARQETALVTIVGFGGLGKTTLVHRWLTERFGGDGETLFLGWSFYSQGTREQAGTSDSFLLHGFEALGEPYPPEGSLWTRGRALARALARRRSVVVLDGLEPLQYGPGSDLSGKLKDAGLRGFLDELTASPGRAFCLVTTRVPLTDECVEPGATREERLRVLTPDAACELLAGRGVAGTREELEAAARFLGYHPLALTLAAEYQRDFGDGTARAIPDGALLTADLPAGQRVLTVLDAYDAALASNGRPIDRELARVMGLFDRAVRLEWIGELRRPPAIPGLTEALVESDDGALRESIGRLRAWGLVRSVEVDGARLLDTHPLIREYFEQRLRADGGDAWRRAHARLFEYLSAAAEPFPSTLRAMEPLMLAVVHGCKAGLYARARRDVYLPRIMRGDDAYAANRLGATGVLLSALAHFFDEGRWGALAEDVGEDALDLGDRIGVLSEAAMYLSATRGYACADSAACYARARKLCADGDRKTLLRIMFGQWLGFMFQGKVRAGTELADLIWSTAVDIGEPTLRPAACRAKATTCFFRGEFGDARRFAEQGLRHCSPSQIRQDLRSLVLEPGVSCLTYRGLALWHGGATDRGLRHCDRACARARRLGHAHSLAGALIMATIAYHAEGDVPTMLERAREMATLSGQHGFLIWYRAARILECWPRCVLGEDPATVASEMERRISEWGSTGERLLRPFWLALLADVYRRCDRTRDAIATYEDALAMAQETGEHWWDAEMCRQLALLAGRGDRARRWLERAAGLAREQGSRPLAARVAETAAGIG